MTIFNPAEIIHTPEEVAQLAKERVQYIQDNQHRTLRFFIPGMDDYILPALPGEVICIQAQTHNYKSSFMDAWEVAAARQLEKEGRQDEVIVHVSVEESVEQQVFRLLARETNQSVGQIARGNVHNWDDFTAASIRVGNVNIYRVGHSLMRPEVMPKLHMSNMFRALKYMQNKLHNRRLTFAAIFFDYLQAFPFDDEVRRSMKIDRHKMQIREDIYRIFQAASHFNCPVFFASQCKQELGGAPSKFMYIPGIYDSDGAKEIADRSDKVVSLWMPKTTLSIGMLVEYNNIHFTVDENLLFTKLCKQRGGGPSGRVFQCRVDFIQNKILLEERKTGLASA